MNNAWRPALTMIARAWRLAGLVLVLLAHPVAAQTFSLNLDDISGEGWSAHAVKLGVEIGGAGRIEAGLVKAMGREFRDVSVQCASLALTAGQIKCGNGRARVLPGEGGEWNINFVFETRRKTVQGEVSPAPGQRIAFAQGVGGWQLNLEKVDLARLAPLLNPATMAGLVPSAGVVEGAARTDAGSMTADIKVVGLAFSDAAGLHAGEKIAASLNLRATRDGAAWNWESRLQWSDGAVFWAPFYIAEAGHSLVASGRADDQSIAVRDAVLEWRQLGQLQVALDWDRPTAKPGLFKVSGKGLALAGLRPFVPQAWAEQARMEDLVLEGRADVLIEGEGDKLTRARLALVEAGAAAPTRGLMFKGLNLELGYLPAGVEPLTLRLRQAQVRDLALGPIRTRGEVRDGKLFIPSMVIPMLDGVLALAEIEIDSQHARLQGALTPISMERLTKALHWHPMGGDLSFVLPKVRYALSTLEVDGALNFKVFGGDASVEQIRLENPFGTTPRLTANVHLKRLNLEEMTGAVKFGTITGFVDVDVEGLIMESWQPLQMDARVLTSSGAFAKRISQRAVQNISSIGGAGAGAAIQRSFLRFFDAFGYDKIGLSCKLRNGICEMGGAENSAGSFTLIKGGGLPAVNVVGYNRFVGWQELLDRIQAVIDGNSKPIIE